MLSRFLGARDTFIVLETSRNVVVKQVAPEATITANRTYKLANSVQVVPETVAGRKVICARASRVTGKSTNEAAPEWSPRPNWTPGDTVGALSGHRSGREVTANWTAVNWWPPAEEWTLADNVRHLVNRALGERSLDIVLRLSELRVHVNVLCPSPCLCRANMSPVHLRVH